MKFWLLIFVILFISVELFEWLKDFALLLPLHVLGGALLAIASNYDKGITSVLSFKSTKTESPLSQTATLIEEIGVLEQSEKNISK